MIKNTLTSNSTLVELTKAILFYSSRASSDLVISVHDVEHLNGKATIKEGRLASQLSIRKFIKLEIGEKVKNELNFLLSNILAQDDNNIVLWVPPGKQGVFFPALTRCQISMQRLNFQAWFLRWLNQTGTSLR